MKGKKLLILAVVAVALVILAIRSSEKAPDASLELIGTTVLTGLDINNVDALKVVGANDSTTIERGESGWVVKERFGYPADFEKVRDTVINLVEVKISDVVDLDPSEFTRLDIAPPSSTVNSKRVSLMGSGKVLGELILGKEHMDTSSGGPGGMGGMGGYPDGRYVSNADLEKVYRVSETFSALSDKPIDWVDTDLFNVEGSEIAAVSISGSGRAPVSLVAEGSDLTLTDLAETEELETSKVSSIKNALSFLNMRDIAAPELTDEAMGFNEAVEFVATTMNGMVYTLRVGGKAEADGRYLRASVSYTAPAPPESAGDEAADVVAQRAAAEKEATSTAETLNAKFKNWTYIIASYKGDALITERSALVKEKKEESEEESASETSETAESDAVSDPVAEPAVAPDAEPAAPSPESIAIETNASSETEAPAAASETPEATASE